MAQNNTKKYRCDICNFSSNYKLNRHLKSKKHLKNVSRLNQSKKNKPNKEIILDTSQINNNGTNNDGTNNDVTNDNNVNNDSGESNSNNFIEFNNNNLNDNDVSEPNDDNENNDDTNSNHRSKDEEDAIKVMAENKKKEYLTKYINCLFHHGALRLNDYQNGILKGYKDKYSILPYKIADALFTDISYLLLVYS
tara:strand:- start:789 stop:1370 length:582 start_codon:yes stop_codon:yes gene_type:complete